jgi:hypothetical protein
MLLNSEINAKFDSHMWKHANEFDYGLLECSVCGYFVWVDSDIAENSRDGYNIISCDEQLIRNIIE